MNIKAEVVADSKGIYGDRLTSLVLTYPRIIHSEMMTHRMFSRNASSSRAVPVDKMIKAVRENTFCPFEFQKSHKGMQGTEYFTGIERQECINLWLESAELALQQAEKMKAKGISKQIINRILEPYQYYTVLITGSEEAWNNFFSLRCPQYEYINHGKKGYCKSWKDYIKVGAEILDKEDFEMTKCWEADILDKLKVNKGQAEIHMMALSEKIYDAMNESVPEQLSEGMWHIPFMSRIDSSKLQSVKGIDVTKEMIKISTAMAARTSYTVVGDEKEVDYSKMIELHDRLIEMRHDSTLEHCARAMSDDEYETYIKGKCNYYQMTTNLRPLLPDDENYGWCNNFKGFIPYRYLLESQLKK